MPAPQFRNWIFTLNNPTPEEKTSWESYAMGVLTEGNEHVVDVPPPAGIIYAKFQLEKGKKGTIHFQGFLHTKRMTKTAIRKILPRAHIEPADHPKKAMEYCGKEDTRVAGPYEFGIKPKQGKRTDLDEVADAITKGATLEQLGDEFPVQVIKFHKGIQFLKNLKAPKRTEPPQVFVYTGLTGTGKTRKAFELAPNAYFKPNGDWWDGYDDHEDVIIDDFSCDMKLTQLLRLCDRYPMQVPFKGGFRQFTAKRIFLTSNIPFEEWYSGARPEHYEALKRRVIIFENFSGGLVLPTTSGYPFPVTPENSPVSSDTLPEIKTCGKRKSCPTLGEIERLVAEKRLATAVAAEQRPTFS